jgi:putative restriction endonuclease
VPAVTPREIIGAILYALEESGAQGSLLSAVRTHPRKFRVATPEGGVTIWVYIWTVTHGGATRSAEEYRIQMTTVQPPLEFNPNGPTLLLGWYPDLGIFAGFDIRRHQNFSPGSNSVQVSLSALSDASNFGWGFYRNQYGEIVVTFRPSEFLNYIRYAEDLPRSGNRAADLLTRVAKLEPIDTAEIEQMPAPRRRIVQTIRRLARAANFRDQVVSAYNSRCAVTGIQLRLVDAAHILPVGAEGSRDTVTNGICLSPTYHRAFDHGLIYLSPNYRMLPNEVKIESLRALGLVGGLDQFLRYLNREIFLPANPAQRPSIGFIRRANTFRKIPGF